MARWMGACGLVLAVAACSDGDDGSSGAPPAAPPPPAEFAALYDELAQTLTASEASVDAQWDGTVTPVAFAGALSRANGNSTIGLLTPLAWTRIVEQLDAFQAMGTAAVKIETQYPTFTPAFHAHLAANPPPGMASYSYAAGDFIGSPASFYNRLAAEIRSRGMRFWVEHATIFAAFSPTPADGYFASMRALGVVACRQRYRDERAAEAVAIVSNLAPDWFTLVEEPNTQNANFGYFPGGIPILTPTQWQAYAQYAAQQIDADVPGHATLLGAGSGTWDSREYTELFAAVAEIDYIDLHVYPLRTDFADFLQNALDWADYVRGVAPSKRLMIGEGWLYKAGAAELAGGPDPYAVYGRDVWSFWEPLDRQFLEVLWKIAQLKRFDGVMPFWSQYYFAYLEYGDPAYAGMSGVELIGAAGAAAVPNMQTVTLTGTGEKFREIVAR